MTWAGVDTREAEDPLVLAVDAGTSSLRALVYDAAGRPVRGLEVHRPYHLATSVAGGATLDMPALFDLTCDVLDQLTTALQSSRRHPAAVSWDTFWHSLAALDEHGTPLTPLLTWADTRSAAQVRVLASSLDPAATYQRTGAPLHASYWPAKILWLQHTHPAVMARAAWYASFAEYLVFRLSGQRRVSVSMASATGLFDQALCTWDGTVLGTLGISSAVLSAICDPTDSRLCLRPEFAARWPSLAHIPWFLPLGDGACNNVGSGGTDPTTPVLMVGTSGAMRVVLHSPYTGTPRGLWTYRVDRNRLVQGGALSAGGNVHAWLSALLNAPPGMREEVSLMPPDSHGLTVLPFLAGERSPDWWPSASGTITGLTLHTTSPAITRAFLEAVAYRFGAIWGIMNRDLPPPGGLIGSGVALSHSPEWAQIICDVLGVPLTMSPVPEATSRGSALLALEALGTIPAVSDLPTPRGAVVNPTPRHTRIYAHAMHRQESLLDAMRIWSGTQFDPAPSEVRGR